VKGSSSARRSGRTFAGSLICGARVCIYGQNQYRAARSVCAAAHRPRAATLAPPRCETQSSSRQSGRAPRKGAPGRATFARTRERIGPRTTCRSTQAPDPESARTHAHDSYYVCTRSTTLPTTLPILSSSTRFLLGIIGPTATTLHLPRGAG
jgi:hypothetical protein